jgi:hypothetical protein
MTAHPAWPQSHYEQNRRDCHCANQAPQLNSLRVIDRRAARPVGAVKENQEGSQRQGRHHGRPQLTRWRSWPGRKPARNTPARWTHQPRTQPRSIRDTRTPQEPGRGRRVEPDDPASPLVAVILLGPMTHCEQPAIPRTGALTTRVSTTPVRQSGDRAHAIAGGWRG